MATSSFDIGEKLDFQGSSARDTYASANTLFNNILPNVYIAAGLVIFFMIVIGGFTIIANAGDAEKTKEGSKMITSAIIGLLIVFASYWIIQLVQLVTGIQILQGNPL